MPSNSSLHPSWKKIQTFLFSSCKGAEALFSACLRNCTIHTSTQSRDIQAEREIWVGRLGSVYLQGSGPFYVLRTSVTWAKEWERPTPFLSSPWVFSNSPCSIINLTRVCLWDHSEFSQALNNHLAPALWTPRQKIFPFRWGVEGVGSDPSL